jgi:hypothetical protein
MYQITSDFPEFVYRNPHNRDDPNDRANWYWREGRPNPDSQRLESNALSSANSVVSAMDKLRRYKAYQRRTHQTPIGDLLGVLEVGVSDAGGSNPGRGS